MSSSGDPHPTTNDQRSVARLVAIETAVAHVQHDVEQLHRVLLEMQTEVRRVQMAFDKLAARVDRLAEPPEVRDPETERPPHY